MLLAQAFSRPTSSLAPRFAGVAETRGQRWHTDIVQVGYGDAVPITLLGKVVAGCAMVVSVLIMALPISVIGTHFSNQWIEYKDVEQFKENNIGAPYFEKLTKSFKEHYFLMDDLAKKCAPYPPPATAPNKRKFVVLRVEPHYHSPGQT